jgi:hypothetical protein
MRKYPQRLGLLVLMLCAAQVGAMPGQGQDKGQHKSAKHVEKAHKAADKEHKFQQSKPSMQQTQQASGFNVMISSGGISVTDARQLVRQYQVSGGRQLPPGIRKQLARGKPLPPGIAKKVSQPELLEHLPRHDGYEWQICGSDLVLVAVATAVIADVLFDVF